MLGPYLSRYVDLRYQLACTNPGSSMMGIFVFRLHCVNELDNCNE